MRYLDQKIVESARTVDRPFNKYRNGGEKVPTTLKVKLEGEQRLRRVYAIQYGNIGSAYIIYRGEERMIRDDMLPF